MKRVIFALYDDIEHIFDRWQINSHASEQINAHFDRLLHNKEQYAEKI